VTVEKRCRLKTAENARLDAADGVVIEEIDEGGDET